MKCRLKVWLEREQFENVLLFLTSSLLPSFSRLLKWRWTLTTRTKPEPEQKTKRRRKNYKGLGPACLLLVARIYCALDQSCVAQRSAAVPGPEWAHAAGRLRVLVSPRRHGPVWSYRGPDREDGGILVWGCECQELPELMPRLGDGHDVFITWWTAEVGHVYICLSARPSVLWSVAQYLHCRQNCSNMYKMSMVKYFVTFNLHQYK